MSYEAEEGDVLLETELGETFTIENIEDGIVEFDDQHDYYVEEVEGFVEDGFWAEVEEDDG